MAELGAMGVSPSALHDRKGQTMRWNIRGRDGKTGNVTNVSIEAPSLAEAEQIALYNGMVLLEADRRQNSIPPAKLSYSSASTPLTSRFAKSPDEEKYAYLSGTAAWLGKISMIVTIIGCVIIVWPWVKTLILLARHEIKFEPIPLLLSIISESIPGCFVLLAAAAGRMLAAIGMATRDLAEDSSKRQREKQTTDVQP
jgi:hypothetical protein